MFENIIFLIVSIHHSIRLIDLNKNKLVAESENCWFKRYGPPSPKKEGSTNKQGKKNGAFFKTIYIMTNFGVIIFFQPEYMSKSMPNFESMSFDMENFKTDYHGFAQGSNQVNSTGNLENIFFEKP